MFLFFTFYFSSFLVGCNPVRRDSCTLGVNGILLVNYFAENNIFNSSEKEPGAPMC